MKNAAAAVLVLTATLLPAAVMAADADLLRCLALGDKEARLSCYDDLATAVRNAPARPEASKAAAAPTAASTADQDFGRASMAKPATAATPTLASSIKGTISEWHRGQQIQLANGQVWVVNDEPANFKPLQDPAVKINPGMLGSYFMTIEGVSFQVKVKRVQ